MTSDSAQKSGFRLPILQGILPIDRTQLPLDIVAGITLAALAIPEVMGYTQIAGMPVITGLYTILIPMALFALFGSSRHLVVGADSATAAKLLLIDNAIEGMPRDQAEERADRTKSIAVKPAMRNHETK